LAKRFPKEISKRLDMDSEGPTPRGCGFTGGEGGFTDGKKKDNERKIKS
jgi:hypothetical protein